MEVKKHSVIPCDRHLDFHANCHSCLVASVVRLCEVLENHPERTDTDPPAQTAGLNEVFNGTHVAQFTEGWTTNTVALPLSDEDIQEGVIRYTVEFRKNQ